MTEEEINNKVMSFQQIIIDSQSKDIQEISRDYVKLQEKYIKLKEAVEKIENDIGNIIPNTVHESEIIMECLGIIDEHMEGLI